jgi:hypothetical protein
MYLFYCVLPLPESKLMIAYYFVIFKYFEIWDDLLMMDSKTTTVINLEVLRESSEGSDQNIL